ncbi:hypothetical protein FOZ63_024606, partial [Perkinsus olseni]
PDLPPDVLALEHDTFSPTLLEGEKSAKLKKARLLKMVLGCPGACCHLVTADVDGTLLDVTQLDWLVAPKSAEDRHKADMKKFEEKISRYVPAVVVVCAMDIRCRGLMRDLSDSCSWLVSTHPVLKQSKSVLPSPQVVWGDSTIPRIVAMRSNKAEKDGLTFLQRLGLSMCRFMQDPLAETVQLWSDEPSGLKKDHSPARGVLCPVHGEDVTFEEVLAAVSNPHPFELTRLARDTWPVAKEACCIAWHFSGAADSADEKSMLFLIKKRMCLPSAQSPYITMVLGGPSRYRGRDLKELHSVLAITDYHFDCFIQQVGRSLRDIGATNAVVDDAVVRLEAILHDGVAEGQSGSYFHLTASPDSAIGGIDVSKNGTMACLGANTYTYNRRLSTASTASTSSLKSPHPRRTSVRPTSNPYSKTMISSLRVGSKDWCLEGRVVSKSEVFGISTGDTFHAHVSDSNSDTVKLLFYDEAAHKFHSSIQIGGRYYFRNGKVMRAHSTFNKDAHVEIKFDTSAVIEAADDIEAVTETFRRLLMSALMGVTVCAVGTSFPNFYASLIMAKAGRSSTAIANALGSNIQNIFIALALPWISSLIRLNEPRGLYNLGNSCYLNSLLQCLGSNEGLRAAIQHQVSCNHSKQTACTDCALSRLFSLMHDPDNAVSPVYPTEVVEMMTRSLPLGRQHDAHEAFHILAQSTPHHGSSSELAHRGVFESRFGFFSYTTLICSECGRVTHKQEWNLDLVLSVNDETSLENCLRSHFASCEVS